MHVQYRRPQNALRFLSRDAMLARYMRSSRVMQSVYPSVRPSVRPSQAGIASQRLGELSWRLPSTCAALCYKEIWVGLSSKIRVLSSAWHFVPNSGLGENFAAASRSRCQQNSSSSSTVEFVDDTYTTIDESWLFATSK